MIQVIMGIKGSGKTKRLIDLANDAVKVEHGNVVFIDDDKRYMYDLKHQIRFINAGDYALGEHRSRDWFYGLLGGILAANHDISIVYVDAFMRLINNKDYSELQPLFEKLETLSKDNDANFVISVSGDPEDLPEFIKNYAV